jgi:Ca-activated chloride channel homolog
MAGHMIYTFFGITWHHGEYFFILPLLIGVLIFIVRGRLKIGRAVASLVGQKYRELLFAGFSLWRYTVKIGLLVGGIVFLFLAATQPQWGRKEHIIQQQGRDVLIVLDVSRSMLAQDMRPNRLEFAKLKIRSLLATLTVERVGLILFSGSAFVQCPLTVDHDSFLMFLNQVDVETIASGTTALDSALAKTVEVFAANQGRKNKLVVLITDGEDFSMNLERIKEKAQHENIRLFTLGIGTSQGAPIPVLDRNGNIQGYEKDQDGKVALSVLNEPTLERLSKEMNGLYIKATYRDNDIGQITQAIQKFEQESFGDKKVSLYEERYPLFTAIALFLFAVEWIL